MEIKLTREQIKKSLKDYYKKYEGIDTNISITSNIEAVGYYESKECVVKITREKIVKVLGEEIKTKEEIEENELERIFKTVLEDEGYELTGLTIDKNIKYDTVGYGMGEETVEKPFFGGIILNVKEKEIKDKKLGDYEKALYIIDMNNGFVNFGDMANPEYNKLVPEQLKLIEKVRSEGGLVNFVLEGHDPDAIEFNTYPKHCVKGTEEADLIPELIGEQDKENTKTYYKNSINGMLNRDLQKDIRVLGKLKEVIVAGVCTDLCVFDFTRTYLRYLDELNKPVKVFVVSGATDTFDAPGHDRNEWTEMAYKFMTQAGAEVVTDTNELKEKEKQYSL